MYKSKIIDLLKTFTSKELKHFSLFLESPYFNSNKELINFFSVIKKKHPLFPIKDMHKPLIFKKLYPKQAYNDKELRYLMSNLLALAEQFILIQRIEKNKDFSFLLLDEFSRRGLNKHYTYLKNKINNNLLEEQNTNIDYFLKKIKFTDIELRYESRQHLHSLGHKIQENSDTLNRFYTLKKLKNACIMLNRQTFSKENYTLDFPENWLEWLEKNNYWNEKIIELYVRVFLVLRFPDKTEYFEDLIELLQTDTSKIAQPDLKELLLYAINYCVGKTREGQNNYVEKALSLYLKGIETEALLEDGYFSPQAFNNVVKLALRLEKFSWIEQFMEDHKKHLPPEFRKNTMLYNYAELYCYKKDFNKALDFLNKVVFSDLSYQLGSRIMLSKIYYELKEETALLSLFSSFMMFLKRNRQISESLRKSCLNFCDLLFSIMKGKTDKLEDKINNTSLLADRNWLLEKLAEINHTHKQ